MTTQAQALQLSVMPEGTAFVVQAKDGTAYFRTPGNAAIDRLTADELVNRWNAASELLACLESALRYIEVRNAYQGAMTANEVEEAIKRNVDTSSVAIMANSCHTLASFGFHRARAAIRNAKGAEPFESHA